MKSLNVQFSGSTVLWGYLYNPATDGEPQAGQRVVVPTKLKNDGTVTITIATVVDTADTVPAGVHKEIIAFLSVERIAQAQELVAKMEATPEAYAA